MTRELSEIISDMRNIVKPYIAKQLKQLNYEYCGSTDKAEFETEFEMVLTLAEMANNHVTPQEPCEDAVSREFLLRDLLLKAQGEKDVSIKWLEEYINSLPPVTPTHCIAAIRFNKEDLREICNERIEIECTHGTCKDCEHFWCIEDCSSMKVCSKHSAMRVSKSFYCKDFEPKERSDK